MKHTVPMTDFDKKLVEKADKFRRFDYPDIDVLIRIAETKEGRERLRQIALELYHATLETL